MRQRRSTVLLAAAAAVVAACGESGPPVPVPTSISLSSSAVTLDALGATQTLTATVKDQSGQAMTGQTITWNAANTAIATVDGGGVVTAVANGQTQVTATSGTLSANATVTVAQVVTQLAKTGGDTQTGTVGAQLANALEVEARDSQGHLVPGSVASANVAFAVTQGNGSVSQASVAIGGNGRAATRFTLGTASGTAHRVTATVGSASVQFSATATAGAADSLAKVSGDNQTGTSGHALPQAVAVRVTDSYGNPFPGGHKVAFEATTGGGSVSDDTVMTDAAGMATVVWTMGPGVGAETLTATAVGIVKGSPATFSATVSSQVVTSLVKVQGDNLVGLVAKTVNLPPTVKVADQIGAGVQGVTVDFAVMTGGGSVTAASAVSDASGLASVGWTIGGSAGSNTVQASSGALTPVTFTVTGQTAAFNIVVRYFGTQLPTANQQAAFAAAEAKWETLIFGDLADVLVNVGAGAGCGPAFADLPAVNETIDDIVIYAKVDSIDGVNGVLGQAGPCLVRTSSGLTALGVMHFDKADFAALETSGQLSLVVLHEMGHVLGYGTLWNFGPFALLAGPCPSATNCTTDPHFSGAQALAAFDRVGGSSYVAGAKVPVENCVSTPGPCDAGTVNSHWRESVLDRELMTGYLNPGTNPLSIVTLASFWDMNYLVNYSDADGYVWPAPPALRGVGGARAIEMKDDVLRAPIMVVDESGRVVRVIHPPDLRQR
jgi:hypothetical protein